MVLNMQNKTTIKNEKLKLVMRNPYVQTAVRLEINRFRLRNGLSPLAPGELGRTVSKALSGEKAPEVEQLMDGINRYHERKKGIQK